MYFRPKRSPKPQEAFFKNEKLNFEMNIIIVMTQALRNIWLLIGTQYFNDVIIIIHIHRFHNAHGTLKLWFGCGGPEISVFSD